MYLIDTHIHLNAEAFAPDIDALITTAVNQQVGQFLIPNVDLESIPGVHQLAIQYPHVCKPMMGLHPCSVKEDVAEALKTIHQLLTQPPVNIQYCAIGEIGIDLYWDKTFLKEQQLAFMEQLNWAKALKLPVAIHCREAFEEIMEIIDACYDERLKGVFHCFSGTYEQAKRVLNYENFYLGIGGVLTFKKSGLDAVVKQIPLERLVLETDAPYLAPTPHRGKRNEPAYLTLIAQKLADVKECNLQQVVMQTTLNAQTLFNLAPLP